jgi:hypothetical protein
LSIPFNIIGNIIRSRHHSAFQREELYFFSLLPAKDRKGIKQIQKFHYNFKVTRRDLKRYCKSQLRGEGGTSASEMIPYNRGMPRDKFPLLFLRNKIFN